MILTIHRGAKEIGGSCVEIVHETSRLVVDIGLPLANNDGTSFEQGTTIPQHASSLVASGILPDIPGLYHSNSHYPSEALLISHAHADHYGFLHHVNQSVNIYMGEGTRRLIELSAFFNPSDMSLSQAKTFETGKTFSVGAFSITPLLMDHSAFDAYAFLIEAGGKSLVYSGDFRDHGRKSWRLDKMLQSIHKPVNALLLEGTTLGRSEAAPETEEDIQSCLEQVLSGSQGIVFAFTSAQNIDRLVSLYKAAKRCRRLLVIDVYTALVLDRLKDLGTIPHPSKEFNNIRVYFPYRLCRRLLNKGTKEELLYPFQRFKISREEIAKEADRILMLTRPSLLDEVERIPDLEGKTLIYSLWSGYLKQSSMQRLNDFIAKHRMTLKCIHTGGHANTKVLKKLVHGLNPARIIPIHTMLPAAYQNLFPEFNVTLLADREKSAL